MLRPPNASNALRGRDIADLQPRSIGSSATAIAVALVAIALAKAIEFYPPPVLWLIDATVGRDDYGNVVFVVKCLELCIALAATAAAALLLQHGGRAWAARCREWMGTSGRPVVVGILFGIVAIAVASAAACIQHRLSAPVGAAPVGSERDAAVAALADAGLMRLAVLFWIGAVSEELLFRGLLLRELLRCRINRIGAIVVSSALFVAWHWPVTTVLDGVGLFVLSAVFSMALLYGGSVLAPIVAHGVHNSKILASALCFGG